MRLRAPWLLLVGTLLQLAATAAEPQELNSKSWNTVGARLPAVELPRIDGRGSVDLSTLRGRKLLLIHFASW
ncbi:MAG: hypothetical protein P8M11_12110 [Planctomycetota bacterium]|nr:hypothetical protein [Planctomycetota bacterium]MDG1985305.1 hypothetical protein [Planctomycetota bacterium]